MPFKLNAKFAPNAPADPYDTHAIKRILNALGYYMPNPELGMTYMPDRQVFEAMKKFQTDRDLKPTGTVTKGDQTEKALDHADNHEKKGDFVWHTKRDSKVRASHAEREGQTYNWNNLPDDEYPSDERINCRCWAKPIKEALEGLHQTVISEINDNPDKWDKVKFGWHFLFGGGATVTLSEIGYLADVINKAQEIMFRNVEKQVAEEMQKIQAGALTYDTERGYSELAEVHPWFGGGTIRSHTRGTVTQEENNLILKATVDYEYEDTFTDPYDERQDKYDTSSPEGISYLELKKTDRGGTYYKITGTWKTEMTGSIKATLSK